MDLSSNEVEIEEVKLGSEQYGATTTEMSGTATSLWTLSLFRKSFLLLDERWLRT